MFISKFKNIALKNRIYIIMSIIMSTVMICIIIALMICIITAIRMPGDNDKKDDTEFLNKNPPDELDTTPFLFVRLSQMAEVFNLKEDRLLTVIQAELKKEGIKVFVKRGTREFPEYPYLLIALDVKPEMIPSGPNLDKYTSELSMTFTYHEKKILDKNTKKTEFFDMTRFAGNLIISDINHKDFPLQTERSIFYVLHDYANTIMSDQKNKKY